MGRLISAEFRKILTTKLWWVLLIPTVAVALLWSWGGTALLSRLINGVADSGAFQRADFNIAAAPWSLLLFARTINISVIFPMVFGALALSSEITRKTITTSYLTASSRGSVLAGKVVTYTVWGLLYGLVVSGVTSLGLLLGSGSAQLPDAQGWSLMFLAGVVASLLWTLLGLGVGAIVGNTVATLITLLVYTLLVENVIGLLLGFQLPDSRLPGVLVNGSADGMTGATAARLIVDKLAALYQSSNLGEVISASDRQRVTDLVAAAAGARGAFDWWASGLIFAGWTAVFVGVGWLVSKSRDIT
ncbi:MAG: ABC transporter permease subunit [Kutzneria sp.]|nr:ABC transporter permease subunit [Kutzneria sp.]